MKDSFGARSTLRVAEFEYEIWRLDALAQLGDLARLPKTHKVLLENLLRHEDGRTVQGETIARLASWDPRAEPSVEIAFRPSRVLLQDFTGVPALVDLAAMRDAMRRLGGEPRRINPLLPAELVIDHSVQVDVFGRPDALARNTALEVERNRERYAFLRWGQESFANLRVVPPGMGIVHQVNLEHLARVVFSAGHNGSLRAYPDTVVGTDSHTTMVNGLGVLGWGVGGIEAEAALLGEPVSMLIPQVVGCKLHGELAEGVTATDLVLTVTQLLRQHGVVGKFVEFYGDGLKHLALADRATLANMAPEYGATCGFFPVDEETLRYLRLSGRSAEQVGLVEAYAKEQGLFRLDGDSHAIYTDTLELDLATVEPSLAGPRRPQDRVPLSRAKLSCEEAIAMASAQRAGNAPQSSSEQRGLGHGSVVIAAITSCTNTANPAVMVAAGLLARRAHARGLQVPPWVKTSLAPGSRVVTDYLRAAGLLAELETLGFNVVGYGCTTCIGNSGPLAEPVSKALEQGELLVCSVLSGNRNFEGRVHAQVPLNYLASPPLVVAYALAGRMDIDLASEPLGVDAQGAPVWLRELWPSQHEVNETIAATVGPDLYRERYAEVFAGDEHWRALEVASGDLYAWEAASTYILEPPYFQGMHRTPAPLESIRGGRVLALLGDSVTTDHISPAGSIAATGPAGRYLVERGVEPKDFNAYGARRGNHEVMMRGTFANTRLRNLLAPEKVGGWTTHQPSGEQMTIFDAAMRYQAEGVPMLVLAGREYGTGSSRDWAAKGPRLLGVRAVIAESYERIHRSNLVGMGILPLQFAPGENAASLGLNGTERYDVEDVRSISDQRTRVTARSSNGGEPVRFTVAVRIDTPQEWEYYRHGGILPYVLRRLLENA